MPWQAAAASRLREGADSTSSTGVSPSCLLLASQSLCCSRLSDRACQASLLLPQRIIHGGDPVRSASEAVHARRGIGEAWRAEGVPELKRVLSGTESCEYSAREPGATSPPRTQLMKAQRTQRASWGPERELRLGQPGGVPRRAQATTTPSCS